MVEDFEVIEGFGGGGFGVDGFGAGGFGVGGFGAGGFGAGGFGAGGFGAGGFAVEGFRADVVVGFVGGFGAAFWTAFVGGFTIAGLDAICFVIGFFNLFNAAVGLAFVVEALETGTLLAGAVFCGIDLAGGTVFLRAGTFVWAAFAFGALFFFRTVTALA